jgi:RNA polymerase sigma-70 factor, ECF subfamily
MRSVSTMSDSVLISAHKAGDHHAIGNLMDRHHDPLMGFLVNRVGRDAEDLYQETWTRVSRKLDTYEDRGSFRSWLFQIARRLVIDHHRRAGVRIRMVADPDEAVPSAVDPTQPDQAMEATQMARVFEQVVDTMEPEMAQVVRWRLFDGIPFKDIAERQGVPLNTALGRMHRGLNTIRTALTENQLMNEGRKP